MEEKKPYLWIAGVYLTEEGMGTGHIPFISDPIELLQNSYEMRNCEVWEMIAESLEDMVRFIRNMAGCHEDDIEIVNGRPLDDDGFPIMFNRDGTVIDDDIDEEDRKSLTAIIEVDKEGEWALVLWYGGKEVSRMPITKEEAEKIFEFERKNRDIDDILGV